MAQEREEAEKEFGNHDGSIVIRPVGHPQGEQFFLSKKIKPCAGEKKAGRTNKDSRLDDADSGIS
jgi:hypothetical protein